MTDAPRAGGMFRRDLLGAALAGAVAGLGHPPFDLGLLTIAGLGAGLWLLRRTGTAREAFWLGWVLATAYFATTIHWIVEPFLVDIRRHGWMAPFALVLLSGALGFYWAVAIWGWKSLRLAAWALVPFLTLSEFLRAYLFSGFAWGMPSYVLVDELGGQLAAWIGPYGLSLVIFSLALVLSETLARSGRGRILPVFVLVPALGLLYQPVPASPEPEQGGRVVRLVQPNAPQRLKWNPDHVWRFFDRSVLFTAQGDRPDLIVWPETSVPTLLSRASDALEVVAEAADGAPVVLGINRYGGERAYNSAVLLTSEGEVAQVYDKHHLVPFGEFIPFGDFLGKIGISGFASQHGEGYSSGTGPALMDLGALGKALPLICYEAVFPHDVWGVAERPDLLMQLTNDAWFGRFSGPYQHLAQARMRAIEMGLPMIRAANTGISAVIDAQGRVTAQLGLNEEGFLDAALPPKKGATFYARTGDLPLAVILGAFAAFMVVRRRRESD